MRLALPVCLRAMLQPRGHANVRQHADEKIALLPKHEWRKQMAEEKKRSRTNWRIRLGFEIQPLG